MNAELAQFAINVAGLTVASYMDIKTREIEDYVWYSMLVASIPVLVYRASLLIQNQPLLILYFLSLTMGITMALAMDRFALVGGADVKALIVLSINEIPSLNKNPLSLIPPLSIFTNSALLSLLIIPVILLRNMIYSLKQGDLFRGFEQEDVKKKILCFFTSYKVPYSVYLKNKYKYSLAEAKEDGKRALRIGVRVREEESDEGYSEDEEVWVSPLLPLIVFIELGYIVHFLYGNILGLLLNLI